MTDTVTQAVAKRDTGPAAVIQQYRGDFATVLPSHIKPDTWIRLATGLLRRDRNLAQVAERNVGSFLAALLDCARLGLEPGDTYHLVPFGNEIVGIVDYTGEIELIYRAGAVSSVKAELVHEKDRFTYRPDMDRPHHEVDWFGDRGEIIGVYAYAVMKDGATSRVVVMSRADVDRVKAVSKTASRADSPWRTWYDRMALKTAVKQLAKWVPSSAEYREAAARAAAAAEQAAAVLQVAQELPPPNVDPDTGVIDGDVVEEAAS